MPGPRPARASATAPAAASVPEPLPPEPPIWVPDQEKNFSKTGMATTARPSTRTPVRIVPRLPGAPARGDR